MTSDRDVELIRLAAAWFRFEGERVNVARERFGLSATALWQRVNELLDDPNVAQAAPVEVNRLRRQRDRRYRLKAG